MLPLWCPPGALGVPFSCPPLALLMPPWCLRRALGVPPCSYCGRIAVPFCFPFCSLRGHEEGTTIRPQYNHNPTEVPPMCFKKGAKKPAYSGTQLFFKYSDLFYPGHIKGSDRLAHVAISIDMPVFISILSSN